MAVMLDAGKPRQRLAAYHGAQAVGGAALTIIEAARVHPTGNSGGPASQAYDPACVPGYKKVADACHPHGCLVLRSERILAGKWPWRLMPRARWLTRLQLFQMSVFTSCPGRC